MNNRSICFIARATMTGSAWMTVSRRELLAALLGTPLLAAAAGGDGAEINADERDSLLTDAVIAWQYFVRLGNQATGLAPATAWLNGGLATHPFVAMWDIASILFAIVGAHAIGIIKSDELERRAAALLAHIADDKVAGLRLPRRFTTVRGGAADQPGFDASDTGRLLIALKVFDTYTSSAFHAGELVARWHLAATLVDGRLHNVSSGELVDVHDTNYANYIVRGFALWGFEIMPAYPLQEPGGADADTNLIAEVARRGPVGTEPHVLEEIELGYSGPARAIAERLADAQERAYAATGKLYCVSETALDREPWFTYQGYRLDAPDADAWTATPLDDSPKYLTPEFRRSVMLTSTKAAFLWAAARPDAYSKKLLAYVRARAPIPRLGYASGVYLETGKPTEGYSDVNTNAVVLEAIAYILRGRKPLADLTPAGDLPGRRD
jgi:hypothetical protein